MAVAHDDQNNVFVTGRAMDGGNGTEILVMKLAASNGEILWMETIGGTAGENDVAWDVVVGPDNHPVITGFVVQTGEVAHFLTRKLANGNGDTLWERLEPGALNNAEVRSGWLALAENGDVIMAQRSFGSNGYDVALERYAAQDGATVWETLYDGPTHGGDDIRSMRLDAEGNILVAGVQDANWNYNYMALKFNSSSGDLIWEASYDGPVGWYDVANCITEGPGGTVIVSGLSDGSGTGWDWATVAFDATDGTEVWAERFNGPASQSDEARDVLCTPNGDIYVTGYGYGVGTGKDLVTIHYKVEMASPALDTPAAVLATHAWPNPFNPRVTLSFELPRAGHTSLVIYDVRGQRVATLKDQVLAEGRHEVAWDGRADSGRLASGGTYLVQVKSNGLTSNRKIVLAK
jgi:hypothetical protein